MARAIRVCLARQLYTPRTLAVLILTALFLENQFAPIRMLLVDEGLRAGYFGTLLYFLSDANVTLMLGLGLLMLLFDLPSRDPSALYALARTGKRRYVLSELLSVFALACLYLVACALLLFLFLLPYADWSGGWGDGLLAFARDGAYEVYNSMLDYDPWLLTAYTPLSGAGLGLALHLLVYASLGVLSYGFNSLTDANAGFAVAALPLAFDGVIEEYFFENAYYYSPVTLCRLSALDYGDDMGRPPVAYALFVLLGLLVVLGCAAYWIRCKREIRL